MHGYITLIHWALSRFFKNVTAGGTNNYHCAFNRKLILTYWYLCGPGSSVGIATDYRLDGPGIKSAGGWRYFTRLSRPALGPTQPSVQWYRIFPGVKFNRGVPLTTHPFLVPRSCKRRAIYHYISSGPQQDL
jgi:hypothetical protein